MAILWVSTGFEDPNGAQLFRVSRVVIFGTTTDKMLEFKPQLILLHQRPRLRPFQLSGFKVLDKCLTPCWLGAEESGGITRAAGTA
jgi:hypothetical protein